MSKSQADNRTDGSVNPYAAGRSAAQGDGPARRRTEKNDNLGLALLFGWLAIAEIAAFLISPADPVTGLAGLGWWMSCLSLGGLWANWSRTRIRILLFCVLAGSFTAIACLIPGYMPKLAVAFPGVASILLGFYSQDALGKGFIPATFGLCFSYLLSALTFRSFPLAFGLIGMLLAFWIFRVSTGGLRKRRQS